MNGAKRDLDYYMKLPYAIEIQELESEEGGGFVACIPQLGRDAVVAEGESVEEALRNLEEIKRELLAHWLAKGSSVPEPSPEERYSGRFVVRIPKYLHRQYTEMAKRENISLNTAVIIALEKNATEQALFVEFDKSLRYYIDPLREKMDRLLRIHYTIEHTQKIGRFVVVPMDGVA